MKQENVNGYFLKITRPTPTPFMQKTLFPLNLICIN